MEHDQVRYRYMWLVVMLVVVIAMVSLLLAAFSLLTREKALAEGVLLAMSVRPSRETNDTAVPIISPSPIVVSDPIAVQVVVLTQPESPTFGDYKLVKTAVYTPHTLSPVFTKEVQHWKPQIMQWAAQYVLDPNIIATLMQIESCGDPTAVSVAGAVGLFQVLPLHFAPDENMTDPATNARRGLGYFLDGLDFHNGDIFLSFAGYNAGHGTVLAHPYTWPEETQKYLYWSKGIYEEAQAGLFDSPTLEEWMQMRGNHLCRQAALRLDL